MKLIDLASSLIVFVCVSLSTNVRADIPREDAKSFIEGALSKFGGDIADNGVSLKVVYSWDLDLFQASIVRIDDSAQIEFYGGLLKDPMSLDDLAVIVCHELGHVLGGKPMMTEKHISAEGQADYFVTSKCLRRLWESDHNQEIIKTIEDAAYFGAICKDAYTDPNELALCVRVLAAGRHSFRIMYEKPLDYKESDSRRVSQTITGYPTPQCRMDTLKAGALCDISAAVRFSSDDELEGACHSATHPDGLGVRPACWYREPRR